ncbi:MULTISPECIES: ABC transporter ATP-binding protein [unclassified Lentilitoribacter]|uniref:ABC transporter ATP-binding protein n=1 Tax=unclassified Lentilitoribacter TaxID=2647570 RepID=UPI0013A6A545|nr:oligopeptide/dipeptide ABC transporter ATP-binding protein [Lentilitoribacter sp. Alg239-R112]
MKTDAPILSVKDLIVQFQIKRRFGRKATLTAVDKMSFDIKRGKTLAIVGESGSGKTTAALTVARLVKPKSGSITLAGEDFMALEGEALRRARAKIQVIFQDPFSSLNPRLRAEDIVREPMESLGTLPKHQHAARVDELFEQVGLRPEQKHLFPHQFSGGQRQRIGIARALATNPDVIICDEAVSALDVAVQAQILNLLRRLQRDLGLTYLFISHDLGVVQHMCDDIVVMYMGRIVESGSRMEVFSNPSHPYTQALLEAVPSVAKLKGEREVLSSITGEAPDPLNLPKGCNFASRCPKVMDTCRVEQPRLENHAGAHLSACYLPN